MGRCFECRKYWLNDAVLYTFVELLLVQEDFEGQPTNFGNQIGNLNVLPTGKWRFSFIKRNESQKKFFT